MGTNRRFRAASHFGLGGNRKDLEAMGDDPPGWLMAQLEPGSSSHGPKVEPSQRAIANFQNLFEERRRARRGADADPDKSEMFAANQREYRQDLLRSIGDNTIARFAHCVETDLPFRERLVHFWSNHFTVSRAGKRQIGTVCVAYENEAIRASLDDHFAHMLLKVTSHPAMLLYLDNASSIGPKSLLGRRRKLGLNENLAREILELHTLGVEGGYDQDDVVSLAKILTGWTVGNRRLKRAVNAELGAFAFVPGMHEPGKHSLLGKKVKNDGMEQGVAALRTLSVHPSTATHIATKLVRHFVSDTPTPADVAYIADIFKKTDGHLPSIHKAVVALKSAWDVNNRKMKTPHELLVSAYRGLELPVVLRPQSIHKSLSIMNHYPFSASSPAGWPDRAVYWGSPGALKQRIDWGVRAGRFLGNAIAAQQAAEFLVDKHNSELLMASLSMAESPSQAMALLLSSPDFQWR